MGLIAFVVIIMIYLYPTLYAYKIKHINTQAIAIINILLGWTVIGWIGAMVWAVKKEAR